MINSTFTVAPTDYPNQEGTKATVASNDETLKAPRAPDTVNVTLRAYQIKSTEDMDDDGDAFYRPFPAGHPANTTGEPGDPAALTVAAHNCDPTDPTATCFAFNAPDLVPTAVSQTVLEVEAGGTLTFPDGGWVLKNQGNTAANAENRALRHGFFLSKSATVELDKFDQPIGEDVVRLGWVDSKFDTIAPGDEEGFTLADAQDLRIPPTWPVDGSLDYIVVYVDDFREVSEVYENNNTFALEITVLESNDPPVAEDAFFSTDEDLEFSDSINSSVTDPNIGDILTFKLESLPIVGSLGLDISNGDFTYTPEPNFFGDVTFSFSATDDRGLRSNIATATIEVRSINDPPIVSPFALTVVEDGSVTRTLSVEDPDDSSFDYAVNPAPENGTVTFSTEVPGELTYQPRPNYFGGDSFTVVVTDGSYATGEALVTVTVTPVNDAPTASDLSVNTSEDVAIQITLSASDVDPDDALTFAVIDSPGSGSLSSLVAQTVTYTPATNFSGSVTFTYQASDGLLASNVATVTIIITAVNDAPVARDDTAIIPNNSGPHVIEVLDNDDDIDSAVIYVAEVGDAEFGTVAVGEGGAFVTYAPDDNFTGPDSFVYVIADDSAATSTATVFVTVVDLVPDWGFVGLLEPWKPSYSANAGSAIPLKWYYTEPGTNVKVYSAMEEPEIRIKGPWDCDDDETEDAVLFVNDPGSSDLRYVTGDWQFNWDTVGLDEGCYNVRIYHPYTGQINGPFRIRLK